MPNDTSSFEMKEEEEEEEEREKEYDEYVDTSIDFVDNNGIEKSRKRTFNRVKRHHNQQNNFPGK